MSFSSKSTTDRLVRSTAKVVAYAGHKEVGSGSGLLMMIYPWGRADNRFVAALVTNKHVVEGADIVTFQVPRGAPGAVVNNHAPASGFLMHPDPEIDLCLIPISEKLVADTNLHVGQYISSLDIWRQDRLDTLNAIENVVMIGYPDGIIDASHLYPISRRGITATPAFARLNGQPDFMIDCACFPGSSGSPVFLLDQGMHVDKANDTHLGTGRFGLLGFLHAGPVLNAKGKLVSSPPPSKLKNMVEVPLMMNLGICVRAEALYDMFDMLKSAPPA